MKQTKRVALASRKALAFAAAATTLFAGLTLGTAVTPEAEASTTTRDSYADTVGNPTFEAARKKYGLPKDTSSTPSAPVPPPSASGRPVAPTTPM